MYIKRANEYPFVQSRMKSVTVRGTEKSWSLRSLMKHFAMEQWVDFTHDLVDPVERKGMQAHLAGGCPECAGLARFSHDLSECSAGIQASRVPASAVRLARAIFAAHAIEKPRRGVRIPVELIFDSFLAPAPAGLRSSWQTGWQGLYRAGECSLDLRIEPELRSSRASVIGQLTSHEAPSEPIQEFSVRLEAGSAILAEGRSNRFGEFQLDYEQKGKVQLLVQLPDSRFIKVPLKKLILDQPADNKSRKSGAR